MMDTILLFDKRIKECVEVLYFQRWERKWNCRDIGNVKPIGNDNIDDPFHDLQRKINETFDKLIYNHKLQGKEMHEGIWQ